VAAAIAGWRCRQPICSATGLIVETAMAKENVLLVVDGFRAGCALARTWDIGPQWVPASFVEWRSCRRPWINVLSRISSLT
jgi:uncharacterized membrane protein